MPLPEITLIGNLTADPEVSVTGSGHVLTKLRVACSERKRTPDGEWVDGDTVYMNVNVWRNENVAESLHKGDAVVVTGKVKQRTVEHPEHGKQTYTDVEASTIAVDLRNATAKPVRATSNTRKTAPDTDPWAAEAAPF